ncbi:hypothetical protein SAMN05421507_13544, partial [Lentzea jiangxiensis]
PVEETVALQNARSRRNVTEGLSAEDTAGQLAGKPSDPKV